MFAAVPIEEFFCRLFSFRPSFLPVLHAQMVEIPTSGREVKVEQEDPKLDRKPESESDTANSSNFWMTFLTGLKGISRRHWPPPLPQRPL